jgi:hypothetical protein
MPSSVLDLLCRIGVRTSSVVHEVARFGAARFPPPIAFYGGIERVDSGIRDGFVSRSNRRPLRALEAFVALATDWRFWSALQSCPRQPPRAIRPTAIRNGRSTSIRDIKSVATTFRFGSIPAVSMAAARETIKRHRLIKDVIPKALLADSWGFPNRGGDDSRWRGGFAPCRQQ